MRIYTKRIFRCHRAIGSGIVVLCSLFMAGSAQAQSFTQNLQKEKAGAAKITIHHEAAIDNLVNGIKPQVKETTKEQPQKKNSEKKPAANNNQVTKGPIADATNSVIDAASESAEAMKFGLTATKAYCVQAFTGKDHNKGLTVKNILKNRFPNYRVDLTFFSPRWTCRVGYFMKQSDAKKVLAEVKQMGYPNATLITVRVGGTKKDTNEE